MKRWSRAILITLFAALAVAAAGLFIASRSNPWLIGSQHEPRWAWAVGSGRLKVWWGYTAEARSWGWWTSSNYRGLDGQPWRWGMSYSSGAQSGIAMVAVPLWAVAVTAGGGAGWLIGAPRLRPQRALRQKREGRCGVCGYGLVSDTAAARCPECGEPAGA